MGGGVEHTFYPKKNGKGGLKEEGREDVSGRTGKTSRIKMTLWGALSLRGSMEEVG